MDKELFSLGIFGSLAVTSIFSFFIFVTYTDHIEILDKQAKQLQMCQLSHDNKACTIRNGF